MWSDDGFVFLHTIHDVLTDVPYSIGVETVLHIVVWVFNVSTGCFGETDVTILDKVYQWSSVVHKVTSSSHNKKKIVINEIVEVGLISRLCLLDCLNFLFTSERFILSDLLRV